MKAPAPWITLCALLALCFTLAAVLQGRRGRAGDAPELPRGFVAVALGDSRRLLANHIFLKADAYYHLGYYPSIFDHREEEHPVAIASDAGLQQTHDEHDCAYLHQPLDWMDRFGRHFYPSEHVHADEQGVGTEREMLPWLRLAAELDPQRVETYTVAAYWLRSRLGKYEEAEQFLREGLRANPGNPEILFELGRVFFENRQDSFRARNLFEMALRKWDEREAGQPEPNIFLRQQILGKLVLLEEKEQRWAKAVQWLQELKKLSPHPDALEKEIRKLQEKAGIR